MHLQMIEEIKSQPEIAEQCLNHLKDIQLDLEKLLVRKPKKVLFLARGTSDNVATYGNFLIPVVSNIESYSLSPSLVNAYGIDIDLQDTLVIAISQSGETKEIVDAAKVVKSFGAKLISITNSANSSLDNVSHVTFITPAGLEKAVPATKTYTSALVGLIGIISILFNRPDLAETLTSFPAIARKQIETLNIPDQVVEKIAESETAVVAGRGLLLGGVLEAALKMKESAAINVIGTSVADFVHGPIAAVSPKVPLIILSSDSNSPIYPGLVDLISRAKALNAPIITVGSFNPLDKSEMHIEISIPTGMELISPLLLAIPSQILAAKVAVAKGLNPDEPLGLKKITQTS